MPEPLLAIRGLDAFYGDFQALYGVDSRSRAGEVVAIIGANGAGKTTLMRSIAGLIANRARDDRLAGPADRRACAPTRSRRSGIAMVPEGRQLFPSLWVEENLVIGGQIRRKGPWSLAKSSPSSRS